LISLAIPHAAAKSLRSGHQKESTLSGDDDAATLVVVPAALARFVDVLERLSAADMPAIALIGGMAVNIRLSTKAAAHRVTQDIDIVTDASTPTALEVLSQCDRNARGDTVLVNGIEVDIIETQAVTEVDLAGLDAESKLFMLGHRWALETATHLRIASNVDGPPVEIPIAAPAGLVAAKSHAAGNPRAARRATKHSGDLYDIFRLIEVFDARADLRVGLASAPGGLGALVADVVAAEILSDPARAMRQMSTVAGAQLAQQRIIEVLEPFVAELRAAS